MDKDEQWKFDGKCNNCRREKYCNNKCKACVSRQEYELRCLVAQAAFKQMWKEKETQK